MSKLAGSLKVLHIAKYKIELYRANLKHKGGHIIAKQFREIEELFIGSTGIAKDGLLQICKYNCH